MLNTVLTGFAQALPRFVAQRALQLGAPLQRRTVISGPPKYPIPPAEQAYLGVGWLAVAMILPLWGVYSLKAWANKDQEVEDQPPPEDEDEEEE